MKKGMKLSELEKRILYNFVVGERNLLQYPCFDGINAKSNELSVEIKIKPSMVNLNNFDGDQKKYEKCLDRLKKKLN